MNSDINVLKNIGKNSSDYSYLSSRNSSNYINTNVTSIPNIIQAINENLAELTLIQNKLNTDNNINQEILVKKDQLLRLKNDDLMKQLRDLEMIESNIANKDRIIEQTNYNIDNQNSSIYNLVISLILALILCVSLFLYGTYRLDPKIFLIILIIVILCYLFLFLYTYNIFYLKDTLTYLFKAHYADRIENSVIKWADEVKTTAKNKIDELEQKWIDNHCKCPPPAPPAPPDVPVSPLNVENVGSKEIPGHFYYDGTAPAQLLVPTPNPKKIGLDQKIDWVDYSSNGNILYNPQTNNLDYDNKQYYNYKNTTDPTIALQKGLNNLNLNGNNASLVDSETYSTNF
jgi:hypothetical protein